MEEKKTSLLYKIIKWLVWLFYPKLEVVGAENLPDEAAIIVGNHTQMNGPIAAELYCPGKHYTWCAGQMMHMADVPEYAFQDFWSQKPKRTHPFYKLLSYIIAPLSVCVFNNANTIGVYHDTRIVGTFKNTIKRLHEGANVVIFPEHDVKYNHILYDFQDKFIDVAKLYYKKTGKEENMKREHLYVVQKHPLVWLSALCMLASSVIAVVFSMPHYGWWIAATEIIFSYLCRPHKMALLIYQLYQTICCNGMGQNLSSVPKPSIEKKKSCRKIGSSNSLVISTGTHEHCRDSAALPECNS